MSNNTEALGPTAQMRVKRARCHRATRKAQSVIEELAPHVLAWVTLLMAGGGAL